MRKTIGLSLAAIIFTAGSAAAQKPEATEIGVDAIASIGLGDGSYTQFNIPSGSIRVGFPMNERVSIEPRGRLSVNSGDGDTYTFYNLAVGALYHLTTGKAQREGVYIRPSVGVFGASGEGSYNTVFGGVGVGYKKPILSQLGVRYEAAFLHNFNNGSSNALELAAGLSWFTKQ